MVPVKRFGQPQQLLEQTVNGGVGEKVHPAHDMAVQALAGPAVNVTGTVPDVRPWLQHARVVVAPLRQDGDVGSGAVVML